MESRDYDAIVIGAGLGGLAAAGILITGLQTATVQWYAFGAVLVLAAVSYLVTLYARRSRGSE